MLPIGDMIPIVRARRDLKGRRGALLRPIGVIRSVLKARRHAPKQGSEGAPDAWLEVSPFATEGLAGLVAGDEVIVVTWLHRARRDVLKVYPRSDRRRPLTGVFATRSPDRPNPLGLHRVTVRRIAGSRLRIGPIEALDRTPVVDIKPVLSAPEPPAAPRAGAPGRRSRRSRRSSRPRPSLTRS
jgi:tRNA-Thr(GGU) m(6)t(6)A37 methyltransferase TsaA